jgi:hypothetical protein
MVVPPNVANHRLQKDAERSGAAFGSPSEFVTSQITGCKKMQSEAAQLLAVRVNLPC